MIRAESSASRPDNRWLGACGLNAMSQNTGRSPRSFPHRVDPIAILNNFIGGDERTAEVSRRRHDCSVCRVANRDQRDRLKQDFQSVRLDLKVRGAFELVGPAAKRHIQVNNVLLYQPVTFFENSDRYNDRVSAPLRFLKDSACPFP